MLVMRKWYDWRDVISSGILLSSTLSLVIAAATLALDLGIIDNSLHGALILVAILSCVLFPVLSNKLATKAEEPKKIISIVGMNHVSSPVVQDLIKDSIYELRVFSRQGSPFGIVGSEDSRVLKFHQVAVLDEETLLRLGAFEADVIVFAGMDDDVNLQLAAGAQRHSAGRVLVRIEQPELQAKVSEKGLEVFSTLFAARTVLRALIENPGALRLISETEETIHEVAVNNLKMHTLLLRELPQLEQLLILRIYRGESFLIPHGNTEIRRGDRLLVSGDAERVEAFRSMLA